MKSLIQNDTQYNYLRSNLTATISSSSALITVTASPNLMLYFHSLHDQTQIDCLHCRHKHPDGA